MWIIDPKDNTKSVSLTILMIALILMVSSGILQMLGIVATTSIFPEMFYSASALYYGRRLNIGNKTYDSEKAESVMKKVSDET